MFSVLSSTIILSSSSYLVYEHLFLMSFWKMLLLSSRIIEILHTEMQNRYLKSGIFLFNIIWVTLQMSLIFNKSIMHCVAILPIASAYFMLREIAEC